MSMPARRTPGLGWITKIQVRRSEARCNYVFDDSFPPISSEQVKALDWDLGIDDFELHRTHWALKDVELFDVLVENGQLPQDALLTAPREGRLRRYMQPVRASIEVAPSAFHIPAEPKDHRLVLRHDAV